MQPGIKTTLRVAFLILAGLPLTGCVLNVGSRQTPAPSTAVVIDDADAATIAEINAASQLNHDNYRSRALSQIAERKGITAAAQVHLINVAYRCLNFDNSKTFVLARIIDRPDFNDATRHAIVSQLSKVSFDSNRQYLLEKINSRLQVK